MEDLVIGDQRGRLQDVGTSGTHCAGIATARTRIRLVYEHKATLRVRLRECPIPSKLQLGGRARSRVGQETGPLYIFERSSTIHRLRRCSSLRLVGRSQKLTPYRSRTYVSARSDLAELALYVFPLPFPDFFELGVIRFVGLGFAQGAVSSVAVDLGAVAWGRTRES